MTGSGTDLIIEFPAGTTGLTPPRRRWHRRRRRGRKDGNVPVDYKKRPRRRKSRKIGGKMTLAEYFATPETLKPQELVFGAHRVADSPTPRHQRAVLRLAMTLNEHVRRHLLGEVWLAPLDVVLDAERALIVQPDLMVVTTDQFEIVTDRIWGAPALVI